MKVANRIIIALMNGWSIGPILTITKSGKVSMWASSPLGSGEECHKVQPTGDYEVDINALLNEAGVPKYDETLRIIKEIEEETK